MTEWKPGFQTLSIHADYKVAEETAVAPSISVSTTFDLNKDGIDVYSRMDSTTRRRAEEVLGTLEMQNGDRAYAVTYASGLAACFAALSYFQPKRVAIHGGYHGTHMVINALKRLRSGEISVIDLKETSDFQNGDLLWLETPLNPTCELFNIGEYAERAHLVGAKVVVDGTFAPPPLQFALEHGADMVMHSATKFLGGHSDLLAGVLAVNSEDMKISLKEDRTAFGAVPGSLEVWLLLRSLRTLRLRVLEQSKTAGRIATFLNSALTVDDCGISDLRKDGVDSIPAIIDTVFYPSLSLDTEEKRNWAHQQMPRGFGGIFSLQLKTQTYAELFMKSLHYWKNATSLGGVESLIDHRHRWDTTVHPGLLRLSCGLEDSEDLLKDILQAVKRVHSLTKKEDA
uniref:Cystathionine gamma-synthase n=1 Tax=Aplanochytrium stocchinoi TaxID=215587 RepID=A0A7S3PI40_9STRA